MKPVWYDPKADNPPWIKALADVRHMGTQPPVLLEQAASHRGEERQYPLVRCQVWARRSCRDHEDCGHQSPAARGRCRRPHLFRQRVILETKTAARPHTVVVRSGLLGRDRASSPCPHGHHAVHDGDCDSEPPDPTGCPCPNCPKIEVKPFGLLRFDLGHVGLSHLVPLSQRPARAGRCSMGKTSMPVLARCLAGEPALPAVHRQGSEAEDFWNEPPGG
jgi:hypothetical protein